MSANPFLASCDVLYVDHIAVTTSVFDQTLNEYLSLRGARLIKGPALNVPQKVTCAFVQLGEGLVVEILSPMKDSPISRHVQQGGGPYHFCFAVRNIEAAVLSAESAGAKTVVNPIPDIAFDGRRVAFLVHPSLGIFEFVEAYPSDQDQHPRVFSKMERGLNSIGIDRNAIVPPASGQASPAIQERLQRVFHSVFPMLDDASITHAAFNKTKQWDSLTHIQLIMELEAEFGTSIPTDEIGSLTSFDLILRTLERKVS